MTDSDAISARMGTLPESMRLLPLYGGLPLPWFTSWRDGRPDFHAPMSEEKFARTVEQRCCLICGRRLRPPGAFWGSAVMGITQTGHTPPAHPDCAAWSLRNYPFCREPEQFGLENAPPPPPIKLLWVTCLWELVYHEHKAGFRLGPPKRIDWYIGGHSASRAEAECALSLDFAELERCGYDCPGGLINLRRRRAKFARWLPTK